METDFVSTKSKTARHLLWTIFAKHIAIRYLFSGGVGAATDLFLLYVLVDVLRFWYLAGSAIAFVISWLVSFAMQKLWTFQNLERERAIVGRQAAIFFGIAIFNLLLNTLLMFLFVNYLNVWYIAAQVITSILIAIESFFAYKFLVFNRKPGFNP